MANRFLLLISAFFLFHNVRSDDRKSTCEVGKKPVDIVFILDSSAGVGPNAFAAEAAALIGFLHELDIGQHSDGTRVAFINLAKEAHIVGGINSYFLRPQAALDIMNMEYLGGLEFNIYKGLNTAIQLFNESRYHEDATKIVILFSSVHVNCDLPYGVMSPCHVADVMAQNGIVLSTVALKFHEDPGMEKLKLGDERYAFIADTHLTSHLDELICTAGSKGEGPRECPCSTKDLWLDIVFIFDASRGATKTDYDAEISMVTSFVNEVSVSQESGKHCRVAFVNLGSQAQRISNLTSYHSNDEAIQDLQKMAHGSDSQLDLEKGLLEASSIFSQTDHRKNAKNVIVIMSTASVDCENQAADAANNPCRVASVLQNDGVTIIPVALKYDDSRVPNINFGHKENSLVNDENALPKMAKLLCKANCYCPKRLHQFEVGYKKFGECVYMEEIPTGYKSASLSCQMQKMNLADVLSEEKETFLSDISKEEGGRNYFIGLQYSFGKFRWNGIKKLEGYTNFASDQTEDSDEKCVMVKPNEEGEPRWYRAPCGHADPSAYYFCQMETCDTSNYCEE